MFPAQDRTLAWVIALLALVAFEVWRRTLRHRAPTWVHVVTIGLCIAIAGGAAYSQFAVGRMFEAVDELSAADKATALSREIQHAMVGYLVAIVAALVTFIVLVVATIRARHLPEGGPIARTR